MFESHARRQATERTLATKDAIVSGIWANTNLDHENQRKSVLEDIDRGFDLAIKSIYGEKVEEEIDMNNPFFAAMQVPEIDQEITTQEVEQVDGS